MGYITVQYVKDRVRERTLIQLTDDSLDPDGVINETKITNAITYIEARINKVLRNFYTVPLVSTESTSYTESIEFLNGLILKCVMFQLYIDSQAENIPQEYVDAIAELESYENKNRSIGLYGVQLKDNLSNFFKANKTSDDIIYSQSILDTY